MVQIQPAASCHLAHTTKKLNKMQTNKQKNNIEMTKISNSHQICRVAHEDRLKHKHMAKFVTIFCILYKCGPFSKTDSETIPCKRIDDILKKK